MIVDRVQINKIVNDTIEIFNEKEQYLLINGVSERAVCAIFSCYLKEELKKYDEYAIYSVDVEYNRGYNGLDYNPKELDGDKITLDLAVHVRGFNDIHGYNNLICMEFKKVGGKGYQEDENRLKKLTDPNRHFNERYFYKIGYMIRISQKRSIMEIKSRFVDGMQA